MLAKVISGAIVGLDGAIVEVEVDILSGLPKVIIVGLPDTAVEESSERVRSAIRNSGGIFPMKRVVVNLAPADLKKAGPAYDLPIAVGILLSSEQVDADVDDTMFLGELSLDGTLRHTNGVLPLVALAQDQGHPQRYRAGSGRQRSLADRGRQYHSHRLVSQLVSYLRGDIPAPEFKATAMTTARRSH